MAEINRDTFRLLAAVRAVVDFVTVVPPTVTIFQ
jgi:hypothetical protein